MKLKDDVFSTIILNTPLIAIDLIVKKDDKILLGKRVNEPAKGFWFTPGGRVRKDERLSDAFARITKAEIGREVSIADSKFIGYYEHLYDNNVYNNKYSTHYVVLAHEIIIDFEVLMDSQHEEFIWMTEKEIIDNESVHFYTKNYFREL